jgi:hypothetical protein
MYARRAVFLRIPLRVPLWCLTFFVLCLREIHTGLTTHIYIYTKYNNLNKII